MNFDPLQETPRLLINAKLVPVQGARFQPTGFPDLGAAEYKNPDGVRMLLVESAQSMANRLEQACWDEANEDLVEPLMGIPYVESVLPDGSRTNSLLEAHRLNSPYIEKSEGWEAIKQEIGFEDNKPFDRRRLAKALLKLDPNSLLHGVFMTKVGGVVRLPRLLSAFIEAEGVDIAPSGGVKIDRVQPSSAGEKTPYGKADEGFGNVPYHRDEYTAGTITAYFNFDLAQLRGYGLGTAAERFLIGWALFKIRRLLNEGMRLRTACDLDVDSVEVKRPEGFNLPSLDELSKAMPALIKEASPAFNEPAKMVVKFKK